MAIAAVTVLAGLSVAAHAQGATTYFVEDDQDAHLVYPLANGEEVTEFYSDRDGEPGAETAAGLERGGESLLFLFRGPSGEVSLVLVHGEDGAGQPGGSAEFSFDPSLSGGSWAVEDGAGERGASAATWSWEQGEQAGGAYRGGVLDDGFVLNVTPRLDGGVESWTFLSGDDNLTSPATVDERIRLDEASTTTIRAGDIAENVPWASSLATVASVLAGLVVARVGSGRRRRG